MKYKTLKQELIDNDERDENNRRIIRMNVTDDGNFLSPLSVKGNPLISGETAEFLNLNIKSLRPKRCKKCVFWYVVCFLCAIVS